MGKKSTLTESDKKYIIKNYLKYTQQQLADNLKRTKPTVSHFLRKNNLKVPRQIAVDRRSKALEGRTTATVCEDKFIKSNYLNIPIKTIAGKLNRSGTFVRGRIKSLGLIIPEHIIAQRKSDSRIKPGNIPVNKGKSMSAKLREKVKRTWFDKGHVPHNAKFNGYERVSVDGYVEVRVQKGKFVLKHRKIWEEAFGPIPKDSIVVFRDGNKENLCLSNLELITRRENMKRNSIVRYPGELISIMKLYQKLNKHINNAEK